MKTYLTEKLGMAHPVIQAPMAFAAGGALAAAASQSGALGMIGGGYCDTAWIDAQFDLAGQAQIGCGFITWVLAKQPGLLDQVIDRKPSAIFLSFGDPAPFAGKIKDAGIPLICQIQTLKDARRAMDVGADVIVAQGAEAGGHGESRGTMALVPEIADEIARQNSPAALAAAGGISDGRGLVAALALGADGVVIGTRYLASHEALVPASVLQAVLKATGDDTVRTRVLDMVRGYDWPTRYTARAQRNDFVDIWHGSETALRDDIDSQRKAWSDAQLSGDTSILTAFAGEGLGVICDVSPAHDITSAIMQQAETLLSKGLVAKTV